jgi:hypothetical protein
LRQWRAMSRRRANQTSSWLGGVVEEAGERRGPARAAGEAAVQADRHHLRLPGGAFGIEHVEAVLEIGEELVAGVEALVGGEAHVVGVERVGDDEVRAVGAVDPVGQVVGVGIGGILEAAFGHDERRGVFRAAAGVPAERPLAGHLPVDGDGGVEVALLVVAGEILVVDPLEAVAGDLPVCLAHGRDGLRVAHERGGDAEDGHRDVSAGQQAVQAPEAGARAVFVDRFHVGVALAGPRGGADGLRQEGFRGRVAVQDIVLAAFLVVHHDLDRDAGAARPARVRRRSAIADHVARVGGGGVCQGTNLSVVRHGLVLDTGLHSLPIGC